METPLSTKRITRSQTKAAAMNSFPISRKNEELVPESKQRNGKSDRSALIDITNDSPIVGLAMGGILKTPSSFSKKKDLPKMRMMTTPGSGEALLRREVKTLLLQKVEEEAEGSKLSFEHHPLFLPLEDVIDSSSGVRGNTMINPPTPHFLNPPSKSNGSGDIMGNFVKPSQVEAEFRIPKVVERIDGLKKQERSLESEKSLITRSLLFDFSEKSSSVEETSESSSLICSSVGSVDDQVESNDDDDDGVWSIRVNKKSTSIQSEEEESRYEEDEEEEEVSERGGGGGWIDELCERVMKISVNEKRSIIIIPEFEGKHTRFVYNSEDEIEGEEEDVLRRKSPLHLKGLPTPAGKHLRFSNDEEEEEEEEEEGY